MPLADLLSMGLQNQRADIQGGFAMGENLAKTQIALEDEQQQIQLRKQQAEAQKFEVMKNYFMGAMQTDNDAVRQFNVKALQHASQTFGFGEVDPQFIKAIHNAPDQRKAALSRLAQIENITDPQSRVAALQEMSKVLTSGAADAMPALEKWIAPDIELKKAQMQAEAMSGKIGFNEVNKVLQASDKIGTSDRLTPDKQALYQQMRSNPVAAYKMITQFPNSPQAQLFAEVQGLTAQTARSKEDLTQQSKQVGIEAKQDMMRHRKVMEDMAQKRYQVSLAGLNQRERKLTNTVETGISQQVLPMKNMLDSAEKFQKLLDDAGGDINKINQTEARAEIIKLMRNSNTMTKAELEDLDIPNLLKTWKTVVRHFNINEPVPESEAKLLIGTFQRLHDVSLQRHDQSWQQSLNAKVAGGVINQNVAQRMMDARQQSPYDTFFEINGGKVKPPVKQNAPTQPSSTLTQSQRAKVSSVDLSSIDPNFPKGMTAQQVQASIDSITDPGKKAKRQAYLDTVLKRALLKAGGSK